MKFIILYCVCIIIEELNILFSQVNCGGTINFVVVCIDLLRCDSKEGFIVSLIGDTWSLDRPVDKARMSSPLGVQNCRVFVTITRSIYKYKRTIDIL